MFGLFKSKNNNNDSIVEENTEKVLQNNIQVGKEIPQKLQTSQLKSLSNDFLTIDRAKQVDDNDLLLYLKKQLGIDSEDTLEVTGELSANHNSQQDIYYYRIHNVKLKTGKQVEYPISNLDERDSIQEKGIYVPYTFNKALKKYVKDGARVLVKCALELSLTSERTKHNNPLLVNVDPKSIRVLDKISEAEIIKDDNGNILVEDSVVNYYAKLNKQKIQKATSKELETLEKERDDIKTKILKLNGKYNNQEEYIKDQEVEFEKLQADIELEQESKKYLKHEIEKLKINLKSEEDLMNKKLEKLISFIKNKADTLRKLDFIDEDEYNSLLMRKDNVEDNEKFIDFENGLHGDKQQAIKHIQAYLFQNDIFYPYYILEDFFALIQTNDLIILAGESGSGKTYLVKKFAEAIGGVAEIIPVKPNWTSSEDLLGYYNPLEKRYLATPFLEALLRAKNNPSVPYFICLDEMNLARVEYYFADFLSLLENRKNVPEIKLYSSDESSHVNTELKMVLSLIESTKKDLEKDHLESYVDILKDKEINQELKRVFGFSDKDSLIKYHSDLKKMLSGILSTPSSIEFPKNVRIIGTVNIDETTYYLSPKILDRAHIMKFDSPLLQNWDKIEKEVGIIEDEKLKKIKFKIEDLGERIPYPPYDNKNSDFCKDITSMTKKYFSPLGVEVGLRTISQGLNYEKIFEAQGSRKELVLNNFILHKILPKINFDGNKKVGEHTKNDLLLQFKENLKEFIDQDLVKMHGVDAIQELEEIIESAKSNDGIVNYWG